MAVAPQEMQLLLRAVLRSPHGHFKLSQAFKSSPNAPFNDRFKLSIALGSGSYDWTLVLNAMDPAMPPDFICNEEAEDIVEYDALEGIKKWDPYHAPALLKLLSELRSNLRKYHADRAKSFSQGVVAFEIESILGLCPTAEIRVIDKENLNVECLVPIYVGGHDESSSTDSQSAAQSNGNADPSLSRSGSHLAAHEANEGRVADCKLCIVLDQDMKNVKTSLIYPDWVPEALHVVCPGWERSQTHAFDFIPLVTERVTRKLKAESMKEDFLRATSAILTPTVVDKDSHSRASFLCSLNSTFEVRYFFGRHSSDWIRLGMAMVHVHVPPGFPEEKPSLVFQSIADLVDRQPITDYVLEYPYDSQWTMKEIAEQISKVISSQLPEFKNKVHTVTS